MNNPAKIVTSATIFLAYLSARCEIKKQSIPHNTNHIPLISFFLQAFPALSIAMTRKAFTAQEPVLHGAGCAVTLFFRDFPEFRQEVIHWPHAGIGITLPHENHSFVFNINNCTPYATVILITLSRVRKIIHIEHTKQYTLDKKTPPKRWWSKSMRHIFIVGRITRYM